MSIKEIPKKINPTVNFDDVPKAQTQFFAKIYYRVTSFFFGDEDRIHTLFIALMLILVGTASFGLGRLSVSEKPKTAVTTSSFLASPAEALKTNSSETAETDGSVVASKKGTKYHYPWCSGAKTIAEENKIVFASIEEARNAGYTPAANCKGLK